MAREGFVVYHEFKSWIEPYSDAERGRILMAMLEYSITGETQELKGNERFIWPAIRAKIDRDREAYVSKCKQMQANASKSKQMHAIATKSRPTETETETETKTETETETEYPTGNTRTRGFTPPSLDEIRAYAQERGSAVDPEKFFAYYEEGGWKDSKGKHVRNWKQKFLTWDRDEKTRRPRTDAEKMQDDYNMIRRWASDNR